MHWVVPSHLIVINNRVKSTREYRVGKLIGYFMLIIIFLSGIPKGYYRMLVIITEINSL